MTESASTISEEQREQLILLFGAAILELMKKPLPVKQEPWFPPHERPRGAIATERTKTQVQNASSIREIERILLKVACDARNVVLPDFPSKDWYLDVGRVRERTFER